MRSPIHFAHKRSLVLAAVLGLLAACKQEPIVTYRLAKETREPTSAEQVPAVTSDDRGIDWTLPKGWREQPPSQMRAGSFLAMGSDGQLVDISIVPLAGDAGGDAANINRWRGQIGLAPIAEADVDRLSEVIDAGGKRMRLIDYVSEKPLIDGRYKKRLVAAIYHRDGTSWFFKMLGAEKAVGETKATFVKFLSHVRFPNHA